MAQIFYPQPTGNHALDQSLRRAFDYIYQLRASQPVVTPATATTPAKITATSGGATTTVNISETGSPVISVAANVFFGSFESRPGVAPAGTLWIEESRGGTVWPTPNPVYYSDGSSWTLVGGNFVGATGDVPVYDANGRLVDAGAAPVLVTRTISTTAPLTGGGDLSANRTLAISDFTGDSGAGGLAGAVPAPAAGDAAAHKVLSAAGGWIAASQVHGFTATLVPSTGPLFYFPASAFAGIIQGWNVVSATGAAATGSVIIWKKASPGVPTYANAICTALTITGATDLESTDLSAFSTTTIAVGDILAFVLSAATGPVTFMLYYE